MQRHLVLIDEEVEVKVADVISKCHIFPYEAVKNCSKQRRSLLMNSTRNNFYVKYKFDKWKPRSWVERRLLPCKELLMCALCTREVLDELEDTQAFNESLNNDEARSVLDLFAGVGGFSIPLSEVIPGLKVTHAIEIGPSAAKTFK